MALDLNDLIVLKGVRIGNEWGLHDSLKGFKGFFRKLFKKIKKQPLQRALGLRLKVENKFDIILDLSLLGTGKTFYAFLPPPLFSFKDRVELFVIPEDSDLAPTKVQMIFSQGDDLDLLNNIKGFEYAV